VQLQSADIQDIVDCHVHHWSESKRKGFAELKRAIATKLPTPTDPTALDCGCPGVYSAAIGKDNFMAEMTGLAEVSTYKDEPSATKAVSRALLKRLNSEIKQLRRQLLVTASGAMFLRYDPDRPQFMRAVLTGHVDSPYAHGFFLFDIYLPPDYPKKPLKVQHITPGANQVAAPNGPGGFSPNLHRQSGKVCLSLLGTWEGPGWNPKQSNIYQVLSTMLHAVLGVEHPYYMEPGHGGWEGTAPTQNHNSKVILYDEAIQAGCIRYAMLGPMRKPWIGFESVLLTHFRMKRLHIMDTFCRWFKSSGIHHQDTLQSLQMSLITALAYVTVEGGEKTVISAGASDKV